MTAEYVPTDAQRSLVESASAFGITQAEIATQLKISEPTLRKHFRDELDGGAFKANMKVGTSKDKQTARAINQGKPSWRVPRPARKGQRSNRSTL